MSQKLNSFQENISKFSNENTKTNEITQLFCPFCHKFPEYFIRFSSVQDFSLIHECIKGNIIEKPFSFEKNQETLEFFCFYCKSQCNHICIKCKYVMCENCTKEHIMNPYNFSHSKTKNKSKVFLIANSQFICDKHLLEYKYYCPYCKIIYVVIALKSICILIALLYLMKILN